MQPIADLEIATAEVPAWACVAGLIQTVLFCVSVTLVFLT
jgi:hypothetical protein